METWCPLRWSKGHVHLERENLRLYHPRDLHYLNTKLQIGVIEWKVIMFARFSMALELFTLIRIDMGTLKP